jgi:drug/metabolite transporter (DMT)-like permease
MGVLLGLLAALGWGSADFLARYATRLIETYRTLFYMQFIGLSCLSVYLMATGQLPRLLATAGWQPWAWCVVVALLNVVGSLALYRAFEIGVLMIVSPIAASYAALTVALSLLSGETLSRLRGIGIGLALIGAVFAPTSFAPPQEVKADVGEPRRKQRLTRGAGLAVFAAVAYGVMFWLLGTQVTPALGGVAPIWLIRLVTPCTLALLAAPTRQSLRIPSGRGWWLIAGVGVLDTSAYVANTIGFTTHQIAVVSVLASLFSTVTVMLAWLFLRERLHWSQWLGIVGIFLGVALVSV